ncbi:PIG-L family deacetylase [Streptomyces sp. NBC_01264]|uniref:PIG-L family deacetylase n=1 Tax=Streptomyces sp. NBC_01264 TaxID=2903804 RepID=UPI0022596B66|nr:PIG-L family deacetylase [Streptomyces sp. NBC_01264]MCX4777980.1 PIG-L family deacetylase [Streptomyces sp. NBC_01264]
MPVSRRRFLLATVVPMLTIGVTGALAVASGQQTAAEAVPGTGSSTAAPVSATSGSIVQIVAHPDDDLFFMNPDISRSLLAGTPLTTLYLTSGEADGRNQANGGAAKDPAQPADRPHYAEARQNGIRAAYAQMATGDRTSPWRRTVVTTAGGGNAELDVLIAKPQINLVWLQMREARAPLADSPDSLRGLWNGRIPAITPQLTAGTPVKMPPAYTKDQVIAAISGFLERYKPTTIRMQDPSPGRYPGTGKLTDHQDHMYGARFAQAAAASYAARVPVGQRPRFTVQNYVGYHNGALPHSLDPQTVQAKLGFLKTYAWQDRQNYCGSPSGCGDRKVAGSPTGHNWAQSLRYARGDHSSWLVQGTTGRLYAFGVLDGQMAVWNRGAGTGAGAAWQGPVLLPGTGIDPGATTARLPDGRVAVFATRTSFGTRPQDYRREIVYAAQSTPGGPFGAWVALGTPEPQDDGGTSSISAPAVVAGPDGLLTVYVRDSKRTLRARAQEPSGAFGAWQQLGGADLQSDPVTATDSAGRRHLYAATTQSVLAWIQPAPGAPLAGPFPTGLPATTVPLTAAPEAAGVRLYFRRPDSGVVRTALVTAAAGAAKPTVSSVTEAGGRAGYGAVAVAGRLISGRADLGTVGTTGLGGPPAWTESRMLYAGAPAGIQEPGGPTTVAVLGLDAELHVTTPSSTPNRTTWHRAVPPA